MEELSFTDVVLTPAVAERWQREILKAVGDMRATGVETKPGTETLTSLDDGRLRMTADLAPGFSVVLHAEPGDWHRVSKN